VEVFQDWGGVGGVLLCCAEFWLRVKEMGRGGEGWRG
jgi:hypothetical protein